jgi:hypothetical protein
MLRHAFTLASVTLLASACGAHQAQAVRSPAEASARSAGAAKKAAAKPAPKAEKTEVAEAEAKPSPAPMRKLGDFHVYQYGGAFSKHPVTLTEQVVAQEGDVLVVDFVLEEGDAMSALRVRMRGDTDVVAVSRITADGEVAATTADYDALMQKTQFVPDSNDALVGTDHTACLIGEEQVECDITTYAVTYGNKQAKLTITRSPRVPGRDLGGDVVASDGKVLYSARLLERGNEPPVVDSLAKLDKLGY